MMSLNSSDVVLLVVEQERRAEAVVGELTAVVQSQVFQESKTMTSNEFGRRGSCI